MFLLLSSDAIHAAQVLAEDYKFWGVVISAVGAGYGVVNWIKQIRTKDVPEIQAELKKLHVGLESLGTKVDTQTSQIVSELKEMRSDFRTFYCAPQSNPMYGMQMMPTVRAKAPVRKKRKVDTVEGSSVE